MNEGEILPSLPLSLPSSLPPSPLPPVRFMNFAGGSCSCVCPPATLFLDLCAVLVIQSEVMGAACSSRERVSDMGCEGGKRVSTDWLN